MTAARTAEAMSWPPRESFVRALSAMCRSSLPLRRRGGGGGTRYGLVGRGRRRLLRRHLRVQEGGRQHVSDDVVGLHAGREVHVREPATTLQRGDEVGDGGEPRGLARELDRG